MPTPIPRLSTSLAESLMPLLNGLPVPDWKDIAGSVLVIKAAGWTVCETVTCVVEPDELAVTTDVISAVPTVASLRDKVEDMSQAGRVLVGEMVMVAEKVRRGSTEYKVMMCRASVMLAAETSHKQGEK